MSNPKPHTCSFCGKEGYYLSYFTLGKPYGRVRAHERCYALYRYPSGHGGRRGYKATIHTINHDRIRNNQSYPSLRRTAPRVKGHKKSHNLYIPSLPISSEVV